MRDVVSTTITRVLRRVRNAWRDAIAAQEVLTEINTPWRQEGELRWRHGIGGWELTGSRLPDLPLFPWQSAAD